MSSTPQKKDYSKTKQYKAVKKSMMDICDRRGLKDAVYTDKIEEYMDFWVRRCELRDDIKARGVTVEDGRGRLAENRSVSLEIQVSRQMLSIFSAFGFDDDAQAETDLEL